MGTGETVQPLIAAGADVNARTEKGDTPLHSAAEKGTAEATEALIAAGADITAKAEDGRSVWYKAQRNKKLEGTETLWSLADALLKCGRLCDKTWWKTATASDVQAALDAGADVNARDEFGHTPLLWAAELGTAETVQLLITEADITAKTKNGISVWDFAQRNAKLEGTETRWSLAKALGKCSRLCDVGWWMQATASDLQALLDTNAFTKLTEQNQKTAWNLARSSPLKGSDAYWALNEARFK